MPGLSEAAPLFVLAYEIPRVSRSLGTGAAYAIVFLAPVARTQRKAVVGIFKQRDLARSESTLGRYGVDGHRGKLSHARLRGMGAVYRIVIEAVCGKIHQTASVLHGGRPDGVVIRLERDRKSVV